MKKVFAILAISLFIISLAVIPAVAGNGWSPITYKKWDEHKGHKIDTAHHNRCPIDKTPEHSPVPEPTTLVLLGSGLVGLAGLGRKKFKKR